MTSDMGRLDRAPFLTAGGRVMRSVRCESLPGIIVLLLVASARGIAGEPWRYVTPGPGEPMEHPPLQAISLSADKPDGLVESVTYRGKRRLYAQLRYGSPDSTRVAIVVDEIGPDAFDLYVDRDRNRQIEPAELVAGTGS